MGSLLPLFLAGVVQLLGEAGLGLGFEAPLGVPWLAALPYLSAQQADRAGARGRFRAQDRWARLVRLSGALGYAVAVLGFGWIQSVERWLGVSLDSLLWPGPEVALAAAPFVGLQALALDAEVRLHAPPGAQRARLRSFQWRGFALVLVPIALYLCVSWAVGQSPLLRIYIEHVSLAQALFGAVVVLAVGLSLPYFLRLVWDTTPVPEGHARKLLELVAAKANFRPAEWLVWRTGGTLANAAVVGFTPVGRLVLFTDALLAALGPRELVAVVGHEIGHARRKHAWILLAWALCGVLGAERVLTWLAEDTLRDESAESVVGLVAAGAALLGLGALGFGWLSRRLELDADLYCAELTGDSAALASALRQVDGAWERGGWRHFSSARRVAFLAGVLADSARARQFKRRVAQLGVLGIALAGTLIATEVRALVARLPVERIDAALALGEYGRAAALAEDLPPDTLDREERAELDLVLGVAEGRTAKADLAGEFEAALARLVEPAAGGAELDRAFGLAVLVAARAPAAAAAAAPIASALRGARRGDLAWVEDALEGLAPERRAELAEPLRRLATERAQGTQGAQ